MEIPGSYNGGSVPYFGAIFFCGYSLIQARQIGQTYMVAVSNLHRFLFVMAFDSLKSPCYQWENPLFHQQTVSQNQRRIISMFQFGFPMIFQFSDGFLCKKLQTPRYHEGSALVRVHLTSQETGGNDGWVLEESRMDGKPQGKAIGKDRQIGLNSQVDREIMIDMCIYHICIYLHVYPVVACNGFSKASSKPESWDRRLGAGVC